MQSASNSVANIVVTGINSPDKATSSEITFVSSEAYLAALDETKAVAVVIRSDAADRSPVPALVHPQPYIAYALISALFAPARQSAVIHPSAVIEDDVEIGKDVRIGANSVIGRGARIGSQVDIDANVTVGANVVLGDRTRIYPNVSIYQEVSVGMDCILHSGTVIGSDGFGFAPTPEGWIKIHQLGSVQIGNFVEIGANCAIDRGALGDTIINDGVKIDNLVHLAHNVQIGDQSAIAGQVGIAGSTKIGKHCMFAGQVGITGHVELADNITVTGQGMITRSIKTPGTYSSGTSFSDAQTWRKNSVRFKQLDAMYKRLVKLEKKIDKDK